MTQSGDEIVRHLEEYAWDRIASLLFRDRFAGYGEVGEEHQKLNSKYSSQAAVAMGFLRAQSE